MYEADETNTSSSAENNKENSLEGEERSERWGLQIGVQQPVQAGMEMDEKRIKTCRRWRET